MAATPRTEQGYSSYLGTQLNEPKIVILVAEQDGEGIGYTYAGVEGNDYMALRGPAAAPVRSRRFPAHDDRDDSRGLKLRLSGVKRRS